MITIKIGRAAVPTIAIWGWEEDPVSAEDWSFDASPMAAGSVPSGAIDNAPFFKDISNQLWLPSCVANATADCWEAACVHDKVTAGVSLANARSAVPDLSRMFIWWNARNMMDPPRQNDPTKGTYNRLAVEVIARFGVPPEADWPYDPNLSTTRPSIKSFRNARQFTTKAFYSIDTGDMSKRIEHVIKACKSGHNVLFGTIINASFQNYESGTIARPIGSSGRHAMVICGYDGHSRFKVRNSWRKEWGEDGYCWMSEDYIAWKQTKSLWVPTKGLALP